MGLLTNAFIATEAELAATRFESSSAPGDFFPTVQGKNIDPVKLALLEDPRLFPYEIEVEAGLDEVTLEGKVSTEMEKAVAAKIASTVPTVKTVSNKLEVVKELPELIAHKQDDIITRHVKDRFAQSATVTAANFDVKTEQGVVSLSGTVRFQVIVLEAAEAARQVPGVKAVRTDKVRIESEG